MFNDDIKSSVCQMSPEYIEKRESTESPHGHSREGLLTASDSDKVLKATRFKLKQCKRNNVFRGAVAGPLKM